MQRTIAGACYVCTSDVAFIFDGLISNHTNDGCRWVSHLSRPGRDERLSPRRVEHKSAQHRGQERRGG